MLGQLSPVRVLAVAGLLLAILVVIAFLVPAPDNFPVPAGAPVSVSAITPRCLHFSYPEDRGRYMPHAIRLTQDVDSLWSHFGRAYSAQGIPAGRLWSFAGWRPAGPDSIDIFWHHSETLRLPATGDTVVGRAAYRMTGNLFNALSYADTGFTLRAEAIPCDSVAWTI
jgi:hypothetical protein